MPNVMPISQLHELFIYEPHTGALRWRNPSGVAQPLAGTLDSHGNVVVRYRGKAFSAARICWAMDRGEWPNRNIRFRDGERENLSAINLALGKPTKAPNRNAAYQRKYRALKDEANRRYDHARVNHLPLFEEYEREKNAHGGKGEASFFKQLRQRIAAEWESKGIEPW